MSYIFERTKQKARTAGTNPNINGVNPFITMRNYLTSSINFPQVSTKQPRK